MSEWFTTLPGLRSQVWHLLTHRDGPALTPVLATVGRDGWPEARMVVLRGADAAMATVEVHTDLHSAKVASLRALPRAALQFWLPQADLQIRLTCSVDILSGAEVAGIWVKVPDPSRQSYGITPAPGTPIADSLDYRKSPDPATFAVLSCAVQSIDAVHLGALHRRASFTRMTAWRGEWLSP